MNKKLANTAHVSSIERPCVLRCGLPALLWHAGQLGDVTNYLLIKVKVSFLSFQRPKTSVNGTTINSVNEHQSAAAGISNGTVNLASFVIKSHENERKVAEITRYQIPDPNSGVSVTSFISFSMNSLFFRF